MTINFIKSLLIYILFFPGNARAQGLLDRMEKVGGAEGAGYDVAAASQDTVFAETLGLIVQVALSLLGVVFISLMIYGGYNWMIARGDEQKVTEAKNTIKNSVIGLIIVVSAYAIWGVVRQLLL